MKLEALQQKVEVIKGDQSEDTSYSIDAANMHLAIQAFYQYSNPIGSIIREITSNGYDAHIEAEVDKPVLVQIDTKECALNIIDFGVGLSPDRVNDIFTKFFSSTKRDTNTQIGAFGLGSKSPLSYTDMFQVTTKYGNAVYEYVIHKAEGVPSLVRLQHHHWGEGPEHWKEGHYDLHYESLQQEHGFPWKEHENGTIVSIPIKETDVKQFARSAKRQLCYFDNVVVDVSPEPNEKEKEKLAKYNTEKIYRGEHIIYRETTDNTHEIDRLHLCVSKVFYPFENPVSHIRNMDSDHLEELLKEAYADVLASGSVPPMVQNFMSTAHKHYSEFAEAVDYLVGVPIGLYFDIGELPILWHRENIEYTEKAWDALIKKLALALLEIHDLQKKSIPAAPTLEEAVKAAIAEKRSSGGKAFLHSKALSATGVEVRMAGLEELGVKYDEKYSFKPLHFFSHFYETHDDSAKGVSSSDIIEAIENDSQNLYRIEEGERRKAHLPAFMEEQGLKLITLLRGTSRLEEKLKDPKDVAIFNQYADEALAIMERLPQANDIELPASATKPKKKQVSDLPILHRSFNGAGNIQYSRSDLMKTYKGKPGWKNLKEMPSLLIYGFQDDRDKLNTVVTWNTRTILRNEFSHTTEYYKKAYLGIISQETSEVINDYCPAIHVDDFLHHRRYISNLVTRHLIGLYMKRNPWFKKVTTEKWDGQWTSLRTAKLITPEEYQEIKLTTDYSHKVYKKDHVMYPYIMKGLKNGYYHYDELQLVKKVHGMYAKFAPLLYADSDLYDPSDPAESFYAARLFERLQLNIHPNLYRKYHVKHIES